MFFSKRIPEVVNFNIVPRSNILSHVNQYVSLFNPWDVDQNDSCSCSCSVAVCMYFVIENTLVNKILLPSIFSLQTTLLLSIFSSTSNLLMRPFPFTILFFYILHVKEQLVNKIVWLSIFSATNSFCHKPGKNFKMRLTTILFFLDKK